MKHFIVGLIFLFVIVLECNAECVSGDCVNGQGTFTYSSNNKYVGQWKDGKRHGQGTFSTSKTTYVGQWKNGKRSGKGTFTRANGDSYQTIDGKRIKTAEEKARDAEVIAIVLGREITYKDRGNLDGEISGTLFNQFAKDNKIEPTAEELDLCARRIRKNMKEEAKETIKRFKKKRDKLAQELKDTSLAPDERAKKEGEIKRTKTIVLMVRKDAKEVDENAGKMAQRLVAEWKLNQALYERYGGRVIFQQGGPEPIDAYRDHLKEQEKKGNFEIFDKQYESKFWNYFVNDNIHKFMPDGEKFINTPWWMMEDER